MEQNLTEKILEYIRLRGMEKCEKLDKEITKLSASAKPEDQKKLEVAEEKLRLEKEKHEPRNWLTDAAKRAKQLQFVTHAVKFIHSDAKASNIYDQNLANSPNGIISTASIADRKTDIVGNAAALDVGKLLTLEADGKRLSELVLKQDITPFLPIAENEEQAQEWVAGFQQVFSSKELATHKLGKQLYWPMPKDERQYHLLTPLFASSFAQHVYDVRRELRDIQFSKDENVKAEVAQKGYKFLPNLAVQTYGGTKPQNISQLNSQRGGKNYLLDNRPPSWQFIDKPPLNVSSVFDSLFPRQAYNKAKAAHRLKYYLEKVAEKASTFDIREARRKGVDEIVGILLLFAATIQNLPAGWSQDVDCQLSLDEQLWLDPGRASLDDEFKQEMDKKDWHNQVASKFASWLNRTLQSNKLNMGDVEHREWKSLVAQELKLTEQVRKEYY